MRNWLGLSLPQLESLLRAERKRGLQYHWAYDKARHQNIYDYYLQLRGNQMRNSEQERQVERIKRTALTAAKQSYNNHSRDGRAKAVVMGWHPDTRLYRAVLNIYAHGTVIPYVADMREGTNSDAVIDWAFEQVELFGATLLIVASDVAKRY